MKTLKLSVITLGLLLTGILTSSAWHICGHVYCVSGSQTFTPLANVVVVVTNVSGTFKDSAITDMNGLYCVTLLETPDTYVACVLPESLPNNVNSTTPLIPVTGCLTFTLTANNPALDTGDFVFPCGGACWLTGGGVKFEPVVGERLAEGGPSDSIGGNVNPGCSPVAGEGGNWNHVAHSQKLHFQGRAITVVRCENVPGIPPGSDSPKTPFNFIEFMGTGVLKGIQGNKVSYDPVYFFARCEDRNEPGNINANKNEGALVDRYFLNVFTNPLDPVGSSKLLFDVDGDPATVDPVLITGGNLQLHISSCP